MVSSARKFESLGILRSISVVTVPKCPDQSILSTKIYPISPKTRRFFMILILVVDEHCQQYFQAFTFPLLHVQDRSLNAKRRTSLMQSEDRRLEYWKLSSRRHTSRKEVYVTSSC